MRRSPRLLAAPVAVLALALAVPALPAGAQDRRRQLQDQIEEASAAEAAALAELDGIRARKDVIDARVAELDLRLAKAQANLAPLEAEAARLAGLYTELLIKVQATQAKLDAAQTELNESAAGLYRSERSGSGYDVIFSSRPSRIVAQRAYLDEVSSQRRRIVKRVKALREDLEEQRKELEEQKSAADEAAAKARTVRDEIASLRAEIEPARAEAQAAADAEYAAIEDIRANKAQYEAELAAMSATSDSIGAALRARGGSGGSAPCQARPVPGPITSGYGQRYHPVLHYYRMHTGADMSASSGTPIHACRGGEVIIASWQGGYGNAVVIDHGGGMGTVYAHQSQLGVHPGQVVSAGQVIGYVGSTGMSTGPHLHFEVRLSGNPVDPAPYL